MIRSSTPVVLSVLLACGGPEALDDEDTALESGDPPAQRCARLEIASDTGCEGVEVLGVNTRGFSFERGGWTLEGTLWYPQTSAPDFEAPGVVILHGSGPAGRDGVVEGSLGIGYAEPIAIYAGLAERLAARGFAVLSYDKRSCFTEANASCPHSINEYPGEVDDILIYDFIEDARVAANALAAEPDVADDILLIGHSQGASFVPILANEEELVHGGAMLAGPMLPLPESIAGQFDDLADWVALDDPNNPLVEDLRAQAEEVRAALQAIAAGSYPAPRYWGATLDFWRSWMDIQADLPARLAANEEPLIACFGQLDFNVGPAHVAQLHSWAAAGLVDLRLASYPTLTHAFVHLIDEPPGHTSEFSRAVLDDLVDWAVSSSLTWQ